MQNTSTYPITLQRILQIMSDQKKQQKDFCKFVGISRTSFIRWKSGESDSYETHIHKIAEFLEVTPEYLHGDDSERMNTKHLSKTEIDIIMGYRKMSYDKKRHLTDLVRFLIDEG